MRSSWIVSCVILSLTAWSCNDFVLVPIDPNQPDPIVSPPPLQDASVAVVWGAYDSVQVVLDRVGVTDITMYDAYELLTDLSLMKHFDAIFINCGASESGLVTSTAVRSNIRTYVEEGGRLYASDWAYDYIETVWPQAVDFMGDDQYVDVAQVGVAEYLSASIVDVALQSALGRSSVQLNLDLGAWAVPLAAGGSTRVLVEGDVHAYDPFDYTQTSAVQNAPLLIVFDAGQGRVLYTSFHNEPQSTDDMDALLEFMLYQL